MSIVSTRVHEGAVYAVSERGEFDPVRIAHGSQAFGLTHGKLAVATSRGELVVRDLESNSSAEVAPGYEVVKAAWSSDGETLAAILRQDGSWHVVLYGQKRGTVWFPARSPVLDSVLRWSADGRTLTYAERSADSEITLVQWSEGEENRVTAGNAIPLELLDKEPRDSFPVNKAAKEAVPTAGAPPNDDPAGAILVTGLPFSYTQSIAGATSSSLEYLSCLYTGPSVWFRFTATSSGYLDLDTTGTEVFVRLSVSEGTEPTAPASRCSMNYPGGNVTKMTVTVSAGRTYWIAVGGENLSSRTILKLNLTGGWNRPPSFRGAMFSQSGVAGAFGASAWDENGGEDIVFSQLLINTSLTSAGGCFVHFDTRRRSAYLMDRSGTAWFGPISAGNPSPLSNGICTISGVNIYPQGEGMAAFVYLQFPESENGPRLIYNRAGDSVGQDTGWQQVGVYTVDWAPSVPRMNVARDWGTGGTFNFHVEHPNGASYIAWAQALFTSDLSSGRACYIHYDRPGSALYLAADDGTTWMGPIAIGSGQALFNSQCSIQTVASPTSAGTWIDLPIVIRFGDFVFRGTKQVMTRAVSTTKRERQWTITNQRYEVTGVPRIYSGLNTDRQPPGSGILEIEAIHPDGFAYIPWVQGIFTLDQSSANSCYVHLNWLTSEVWLMANNGSTWLPPSLLGGEVPLVNSQCTVDVSNIGGRIDTNTVSIQIPIRFTSVAFLTNATRLVRTVDVLGRDSGWRSNSAYY